MTTETQHTHRYRFPSPDGPVAIGVCPCGATQTARNRFIGDEDGGYNRVPGRRRLGGGGFGSLLSPEEKMANAYLRELRGTSRGEF